MADTFDAEVVLIRRNPWLLALTALPYAAPLAMLIAGAPWFAAGALAAYLTLVSFLLLRAVWHRNPSPRLLATHAQARGGELRLGDLVCPAGQWNEGLMAPQPEGGAPHIRLGRRGLRHGVELRVRSVDEGRSLLRALGLDATQKTARFRLASPVVARQGLFAATLACTTIAVFAFAVTFGPEGPASAFVAFSVPLLAALLAVVPRVLDVGSDGLALSWLGRKRFLPLSRIRGVHERVFGRAPVFGKGDARYVGIQLVLDSGETLDLPVGQKSWDAGRGAMVAERIREALASARGGGREVDAALLGRGSRDVKDWIAMLRSIGAGASSFRTAALAPERLLRVVEDPTAEASVRAAAAVALGAAPDAESRSRLRLVAQSVAAPRVRVAIERAAEGAPEEELEAAMTEVSRRVVE